MADLVSLAFVRQALKIADYDADGNVIEGEDDGVLGVFIQTAQEAVIRYLKEHADPGWTDSSAPMAVRMSIVMAVHALYDDKPDLLSGLGTSDPRNPIVAMLAMLRKPTLV